MVARRSTSSTTPATFANSVRLWNPFLMNDPRGERGDIGYAGDVNPADAYVGLQSDAEAVLVDVRTTAEWSYVGLPDLRQIHRRVVLLEWQRFPDGVLNESFVQQLRQEDLREGAPMYFLCRSGARSAAAAKAVTAAGLGPAYNVADGFEGHLGPDGHRGVSGWKAAGLPWRQG
jgi:rhodanese-related sulfurtransferase